ncbi:MAG TPA: hypothetical protein VFC46_11200 [Humisphaera sp.]|nr:hypothetical protein [Humisphaera sp.]
MTRSTPQPHQLFRTVVLFFGLAGLTATSAHAADVLPSPHDNSHLIVIGPTQFTDDKGALAKKAENAGATFDKTGVAIAQPIVARFTARHAGDYTLWVRVGESAGKTSALNAQIVQHDKTILEGSFNNSAGHAGTGGPEGYLEYREKAIRNTPHNVVGDPDLIQLRDLSAAAKNPKSETKEDDLTNDLLNDIRSGSGENWTNTGRVDKLNKEFPFYWWKIGNVTLDRGDYDLRISPQAAANITAAPVLDAAILTTYGKLSYPYVGDINAPRQSYIRFRIDKLPTDGLEIVGQINNHAYPYFSTPAFYMNPSGLSMEKPAKHTATGFTRWYCLQDVKRAPLFNGIEVTLHFLDLSLLAKGAHGATQFAVFPHQDAVVRTIGWDEPDGLYISMQPNFEDNQHQLRTIRDHAREHYELALAAADGKPGPLARTDGLLLSNYSASALGQDYDYMAKTMRLLGFNDVGLGQSVKTRKNYGGATAEGSSWEVSHLPYDEDKTLKQYDAYYKNYFKGADPELWKGVNVFQISDEPGEVSRPEMTAPLWRYEAGHGPDKNAKDKSRGDGGRWLDLTGGSDLHTRRVDLSNCVMEGKITKLAGWIGFRVAIDNAASPTRYAYWHIGKVAPNGMPENVAIGKVGFAGVSPAPFYVLRPTAVMGGAPTPFKVVYEGTRAALYINGQLVQELKDLPPTGGLGLTGAARAINELRIRPIAKNEHIANEFQLGKEFVKRDAGDVALPDLDDPSAAIRPADPPLKEYVEKDWIPAGGIPEAHAGFRKWAAARGLTPDFFGEDTWDAVHMITVKELVRNREEARRYYWSRRYSGYLTPRMFAIAAEAVRHNAANKNMFSFVGLSGHSLYFPSEMPLDMFELGNQGGGLMPGISDWMSYGGWRWDSHQAVAYSVAPFNAGARRWAKDGTPAEPASFPMMHCVYPSLIRSYTMLANQVKFLSYYTFGPYYAIPGDYWSEMPSCYQATSLTCNRVSKVDDILCAARMRPSRVALLYAHSTEYWNAQSAFADRRAAFLALSHEYFQPELVTEDQIAAGALQHYDALYVMDPWVSAEAQNQIIGWVSAGGLLWSSADALTRDELNQPLDALALLANLHREFAPPVPPKLGERPTGPKFEASQLTVEPITGETIFRKHTVVAADMPLSIKAPNARIRAKYATGMPAWLEWTIGKGKVVYIGHRAGLTYTSKATRPAGYPDIWADTGRAILTVPLVEAKVRRELTLSENAIMASPMSTPDGTVVILYNMRPTPRKNLTVELLEPAKPVSVQTFAGLELVDLPFDFHDGKVVMTLPVLEEAQMILVRRKPAPADGRLEALHQNTLAQLDSKEWESLSAGAWFAGFHPEWKLADRLIPMLNHEHWQVRRSSAEALGRLGYLPAGEALLSAVRVEKDSHALGEEALALGRLHHDSVPKLSLELLDRDDPIIRRLAVQAIKAYIDPAGGGNLALAESTRQSVSLVLDRALADPNLRVRRAGIALAFRLDPAKALDLALAAFANSGVRARQERPDWVSAIVANDAAFAEYIRRGLPGGDELLLALGASRSDPALAHSIESRLVELDKSWPGKVAPDAIFQGDKSLARHMFQARNELSGKTAGYLPHVLEHAYDAQLGNNLEDWAALLKTEKASTN